MFHLRTELGYLFPLFCFGGGFIYIFFKAKGTDRGEKKNVTKLLILVQKKGPKMLDNPFIPLLIEFN